MKYVTSYKTPKGAYNLIEVFLVKYKSKLDICLMLKKKKTSCMTAYDSH